MAAEPLAVLDLTAPSRAEESAYRALAVLCAVGEEMNLNYRLIGGQAVQLHAYRWRLGADLYRESADTDAGLHLTATSAESLKDALERKGFRQVAGDQFKMVLPGVAGIPGTELTPTIDVVTAARTSRVRQNRRFGPMTLQETAGLAAALSTSEVRVMLNLHCNGYEALGIFIKLPTEACMLALKVFAWRDRRADRDAYDLWRCLEVAAAANLDPSAFDSGEKAQAAVLLRNIAHESGDMPSLFSEALGRQGGLSPVGLRRRILRIQALAARVVGN
jgi:predicted nucleotidyltransferase